MAFVFTILVFVAFAPTFYLKSFFAFRDLTRLEHIHGAVATAFLFLFFAQTVLISRRRIGLHRKLGFLGIGLAVAMATMITILMVQTAHTRNATGINELEYVKFTARLFWGNVNILVGFSIFVGLGFRYRRRPELHKRLMLLAMLSQLPTILGRIAAFEFWGLPRPAIILPMFLSMLSSIIIYDLLTRGRPHPVSIIGASAIFLGAVSAAFVLPQLEFAREIVLSL